MFGSTARARIPAKVVALLLLALVPMPAHASVHSWSGVIKYATWSDLAANQIQPYDPSDSLNGTFSFAVSVGSYSDGQYTFSFKTDALSPIPTNTPLFRAKFEQTNGATKAGAEASAATGWTATGCIPKGAKWLRIGPASYEGFQRDVHVTINVVAHLTARCDQGQ
jgi:hypothetical protein